MIESGHIACDIFAFNTNNLSSVNEQKILRILFKILHLSKKQVAMTCIIQKKCTFNMSNIISKSTAKFVKYLIRESFCAS